MPRQSAAEIDDAILDAAAGLFASHGVGGTSVAQIAGAVGYSKTGLLHRFPSKQALVDAVLADTVARLEAVAAAVAHLSPGAARDVAGIEAIAAVALDRPGQVALVLASFTSGPAAGAATLDDPSLAAIDTAICAVFGDAPDPDPADPVAVGRAVRVATALAGIAVTTPLVAEFARHAGRTAAHHLLTTVALDALAVTDDDR